MDTTQSPKSATGLSALENSDLSIQTRRPWHDSIGGKPAFLYVEFEGRLIYFAQKKTLAQEKWHFFVGDGPVHFLKTGV